MTASVPSGFGHLLNPAPPLLPQPPTRSRLRLFVREQPQAARACGSGDRCRRPVDPIPIVQLLMTDFNPISEEDRRQLTSNQYIVSCQLLPVAEDSERSRKGRASARSNAENSFGRYGRGLGNSDVDQLIARQPGGNLSGGTYMSPFSADQDPDPSTAPSHPQSMTNLVTNSTAATLPRPPRRPPCTNICAPNPATFFVFSDLCVRTAGEYQLLFTLMNPFEAMQSKSSPILDEVRSETFEVFSAKDFRGMQRTPELARGLRRLGVQGIKLRDKTRESANGGAAQSVSEEDVDGGED
ncbi:hypothetical protein AJ79_07611 [Helicocarpus griseus UAMH5409]|uniref:Velvet domain-containing protein n=1 Tax=Helicocarpus griseus UAMH5409 TaxID=1447875 RepID=A0A2B7X1C8_9EURO|nr:hypothetical protein AJ79_07611 [Helicocarpus griseus UAMH5409]